MDASFDVLRQWRPYAERLGKWRAGSEVTQSRRWPGCEMIGIAAEGGPAEAVGGLEWQEWTGRWPGAEPSEISHLHRAGVMTMSSLPPAQLAGLT